MKKIILLFIILLLYSCQNNDLIITQHPINGTYIVKNQNIENFKIDIYKPEIICKGGKNNCYIKNITFPKGYKTEKGIMPYNMYYKDGKDYYYFLQKPQKNIYKNVEIGVFKNNNLLVKYKGYIGNNLGIEKVAIIKKLFTFQTYRLKNNKKITDIYLNGFFLTEKFDLDNVYFIFLYKGKIGFIGEKNGEKNIYLLSEDNSKIFKKI